MKVQILDAAREDLVEGFGFYESSERVSEVIFSPASIQTSNR